MNGVTECLLFNANSAIFKLYHGENKLIFNEMMMRSEIRKIDLLIYIMNSPKQTWQLHKK
jgi:hypothetical protein